MFKRDIVILGGCVAIVISLFITFATMENKNEKVDNKDNIQIEESVEKFGEGSGENLAIGLEKSKEKVVEIADEKKKQEEIASAKTTISRGGEAPKSNKGIIPVDGSLSSKFGQRWGKQHKGIDIAASTGTNVYAFMSGVVIFSGWDDGGYGKLVKIRHSNGLVSYYAHNSKLLVKEGQTVDQGAQISESGNTGRSTGPHVHFEVRKDGKPVNPLNYIE